LTALIKLTALNVLEGKNKQEQVELLNSIGLKSGEISEITGMKSNYVTAVLSNLKKAKKRNRRKLACAVGSPGPTVFTIESIGVRRGHLMPKK